MKHLVALVALIALLVPALAWGGPPARTRASPPGGTIVEVTGNAANGFEIRHYDGTSLYPPTDSEARAECGEYDRRVERVRCRTAVRVWYRDLGQLRQALAYAHRAS